MQRRTEVSQKYRKWLIGQPKDKRNELLATSIPHIFADVGCCASDRDYQLRIELVGPEYISPYKIVTIHRNHPYFAEEVKKTFLDGLKAELMENITIGEMIFVDQFNTSERVVFYAELVDGDDRYKVEIKIRAQQTITVGLGINDAFNINFHRLRRFLAAYNLVFIYLTILQEYYPPEKTPPAVKNPKKESEFCDNLNKEEK